MPVDTPGCIDMSDHLINAFRPENLLISSLTKFVGIRNKVYVVKGFRTSSTRIVGSRITALRYRTEQGHIDSLIAVHDRGYVKTPQQSHSRSPFQTKHETLMTGSGADSALSVSNQPQLELWRA